MTRPPNQQKSMHLGHQTIKKMKIDAPRVTNTSQKQKSMHPGSPTHQNNKNRCTQGHQPIQKNKIDAPNGIRCIDSWWCWDFCPGRCIDFRGRRDGERHLGALILGWLPKNRINAPNQVWCIDFATFWRFDIYFFFGIKNKINVLPSKHRVFNAPNQVWCIDFDVDPQNKNQCT